MIRVLGLQNKITFAEGIIEMFDELQAKTGFFSNQMNVLGVALGLGTCVEFICKSLCVLQTACVQCVCWGETTPSHT